MENNKELLNQEQDQDQENNNQEIINDEIVTEEVITTKDEHKSNIIRQTPVRKQLSPNGFIEKVVQIKRISKTTKGGRNMRFSALVVIGNKKGDVGFGMGKSIEVPDGAELDMRNGTFNLTNTTAANGSDSNLVGGDAATISLNKVTYTGSHTAIFPSSNRVVINVIDSTVIAKGVFGIGTNAAQPVVQGEIINIVNSTVRAEAENGDCVAVMINVPGTLTISEGSTISGGRQGVIVRGGTATLGDTPQSLFNQIRTYVHAPELNHDPDLQEILDERGREFLDEHWRRNDLIRFGDFERDWGFKYDYNPDAANPQYRLLPLARDVLNANANWTQNEGY